MKKLYISKIRTIAVMAFALLADVAVGQAFKVTSNGNPVSNNDVIELPYVYEDFSMPEEDYYEYNYKWDPEIEVVSTGGTVSLTVSVTAGESTDGFQICWPMQCKQINPGATISETGTVGSNPSNLQIHREVVLYSNENAVYDAGEAKVSVKSAAETLEFTIKCQGFEFNSVGKNLADINVAPEYYTVQGVRVAQPQKGQLLIERKGSKVTKRLF